MSFFFGLEEGAKEEWKEKPELDELVIEGFVGGLRMPDDLELDSEPKRVKALRKERRREGGAARMVDW